ncbi:hypothetical protein RAJCM14343_4623 [Rhodococcus aetherivorans]|uniref:Uncharacterized protein n=1 Tax=Rhodococcus aetherivorans TaxID=191292 RepID=A0ABQ0YRW6_9NOCA|nr:hypothetical protein RAJCM14343_4623 [Rhodococcus aetherivorans]
MHGRDPEGQEHDCAPVPVAEPEPGGVRSAGGLARAGAPGGRRPAGRSRAAADRPGRRWGPSPHRRPSSACVAGVTGTNCSG